MYTDLFDKPAELPTDGQQVIIMYGDPYSNDYSIAIFRNGGFELSNNGPYPGSVLYPYYENGKGNAIKVKAWTELELY